MDGLIGLPSRAAVRIIIRNNLTLKAFYMYSDYSGIADGLAVHMRDAGDRRFGASHMPDTGSAAPCSVSPEPSSPSAFGMQDVIAPKHAPVLLLGV